MRPECEARTCTFLYSPLLLAGLLSCHHVASAEQQPKVLEAPYKGVTFAFRIDPTSVSVGDSVRVEWVLRNRTSQRVSLEFRTTCQLGLRLETEAGERVWYTPQGCGMMISYLEIPARDSVVEIYHMWTASAPGHKEWAYKPGRYRVIGTLNPSAIRQEDRRVAPPQHLEIR